MRYRALFCALWGLSFLVNCATVAPPAGTKCDAGTAYCSSLSAALSCQSGILSPYACLGPKGCTLDANRKVLCDQSAGATAGQPCFPEYEGKGQCSSDGTAKLTCVAGVWTAVACAQGQACHVDPGGVSCR